jgi:hypothetical protein
MTANPTNSLERGDRFEAEVAELLTLRGFALIHDIRSDGFRADFIATKGSEPFKDTYLVEAKDQERPVGNEAVLKLAGAVSGYRKSFPRIIGLLVSRNGFTADANAAAELQDDIRIVTYDQLLDGLIDFSAYLGSYVQSYRESPIHRLFVDPACEEKGPTGVRRSPSLTVRVREWLADSASRRNLLLLGEYGTGKSVFVEHLAFELAEEIVQTNTSSLPVPIVVYLRHFADALGDLRRVITSHLVDDLRLSARFDAFIRLLKRGRILLILDGFDEMAMVVDAKTRDHNFLVLQTLCTGNARVLLTGRQEYFPSDKELESLLSNDRILNPATHVLFESGRRLPEFDRFHVAPFDDAQIHTYLQRCERYYPRSDFAGAETIAARIWQMHDLHELASRPVLLDLIVKTLPALTATTARVTAASLYDFYTRYWLEREEEKGKRLIPAEVKKAFVHELAWKMLFNGRLHVHYNDLPSDIIDFFRPHLDVELEAYDHDVRTCSYLHRDDKGNFSFAHKTFMEFFVAARTQRELSHGRSNPLAAVRFPSEIISFLVDLSDRVIMDSIGELIYSFGGNEIFQENLLRYLARLPLEVAVWPYLLSAAYFTGNQDRVVERMLRQRVERLPPEDRIPAIAEVLEMRETNADEQVARVVRRYLDFLGADSIAIQVFAEHLRTGRSLDAVVSESGVPVKFLYRQCESMERIRRAIIQVCGFFELEAAMSGGDEQVSPSDRRFFIERLHAPVVLVKEILTNFEVSVEETKQFLRQMNLREPEKLTAQSIVTRATIQSFAQQAHISVSAAGQLLSRSTKKLSALVEGFKSLPRRDRRKYVSEIQSMAGLDDKNFRTYLRLVLVAARKAGLFHGADVE